MVHYLIEEAKVIVAERAVFSAKIAAEAN